MANIVVTTTATNINVDFGDYSTALGFSKCTYNRDSLVFIRLTNAGYVIITVNSDIEWQVNHNGVGIGFQVDSINEVVPTDANHLYELLRDM